MATRKDWLPSNKNKKLEMGINWYKILIQNGNLWNVPEIAITDFNMAINEAENENKIPLSERNVVSNIRLRLTFNKLTAIMRDIKRRYFFVP